MTPELFGATDGSKIYLYIPGENSSLETWATILSKDMSVYQSGFLKGYRISNNNYLIRLDSGCVMSIPERYIFLDENQAFALANKKKFEISAALLDSAMTNLYLKELEDGYQKTK